MACNPATNGKLRDGVGHGRSPVFGVGVNDVEYVTERRIGGKRVFCPYYLRWKSMLSRCYSNYSQRRDPSYVGCSVSQEWHPLSAFKLWMEGQDWEGKQLDKDILFSNNKIYSPETCVFIDPWTNAFFTGNFRKCKSGLPRGVYHSSGGKFKSACNNGRGKLIQLGVFNDIESAESAYLSFKSGLAVEISSLQKDPRVSAAILSRFNVEKLPIKYSIAANGEKRGTKFEAFIYN